MAVSKTGSMARGTVCVAACAALALAGVPAAALAGENATQRSLDSNSAAIQETIDSLDELEAGEDYVDGELLVTYSGQDEPQLVELDEGETVESALEDARDDHMVTAAQPNYRYRLLETSPSADEGEGENTAETSGLASSALSTEATASSTSSSSLSSLQYYLDAWDPSFTSDCGANVRAAWELVQTQHTVTVAMLDTGVQTTHKDLADNIDTARMATITRTLDVKVGTMSDDDGHGTHVAGIIAATADNELGIDGSSANASLLPIRVFYEQRGEQVCDTAMVVRGLQYLDELIESGQLTNLHVINMSLGSYSADAEDAALRKEIAHLRSEHQVLTVCAGGNGDERGNAYTEVSYPADYDECLSVTALDKDGTNATWSDYNQYKDISAPGVSILSTFSNELAQECLASRTDRDAVAQSATNDSYGYLDGTSMSAPLVAGICALLWAAYPLLTVDDAVTAITSTANAVNPARNDRSHSVVSTIPRPGNRWGSITVVLPATGSSGAIDAAAAVSWVLEKSGQGSLDAAPATQIEAPARAVLSTLTAKSAAFKASWKEVDAVAGYQLRYRLATSSTWTTTKNLKATTLSKKVSGLKSGKKYYVQVRAYRIGSDGSALYGAWSAKKSVKTK